MKQLLVLTFLLLAGYAGAQENAIEKYFTDYLNAEDFTKVSVTGKMFSLFTEIDTEDEDEQAILEAISKLKGIKGVIREDAENGNTMYADAIKKVEAGGEFEELMSVEDPNENVKFLVRDNDGEINELLMIRGERREFMAFSLYGVIDLKSIGRLSKVMKVRGMEGFGIMDEH